jgi:hypothetical protein
MPKRQNKSRVNLMMGLRRRFPVAFQTRNPQTASCSLERLLTWGAPLWDQRMKCDTCNRTMVKNLRAQTYIQMLEDE